MLAQLSSQLTMNGFSQFAIGTGINPGTAVALLLAPPTGHQLEARQAFLSEHTDLRISLNSEIMEDADDSNRHWQDVESSAFNKYWGKFREAMGPPTRLFVGVYSGPAMARNLAGAVDKVWTKCAEHEEIRWDLNSLSLSSMADIVSMGLFANIQTHWTSEPGDIQIIYFPLADPELYDIARAALIEVLGSRRVHEPPPQLDLFI